MWASSGPGAGHALSGGRACAEGPVSNLRCLHCRPPLRGWSLRRYPGRHDTSVAAAAFSQQSAQQQAGAWRTREARATATVNPTAAAVCPEGKEELSGRSCGPSWGGSAAPVACAARTAACHRTADRLGHSHARRPHGRRLPAPVSAGRGIATAGPGPATAWCARPRTPGASVMDPLTVSRPEPTRTPGRQAGSYCLGFHGTPGGGDSHPGRGGRRARFRPVPTPSAGTPSTRARR